MDGLTDGLTEGLTDRLTDGLTEGLTDGLTDGLMDGLTDGRPPFPYPPLRFAGAGDNMCKHTCIALTLPVNILFNVDFIKSVQGRILQNKMLHSKF